MKHPKDSPEFSELASATYSYFKAFGMVETLRALLTMWKTVMDFEKEDSTCPK